MSRKYFLFALLYFAQGSVLGYFTSLNALYLRSFDVSMTRVGIFSAIALIPLVLKILWGMLSDKVNLFGFGYRKPYIIIGLLMQAGGQLAFPFIHPGHSFGLLVAVAFFSLLGMALYDTCTDGLALDTTTSGEMGKVQGIMVAGRAVGIVVISAAVGMLSQMINWYAVFMALAVMTMIPIPLVLLIREPERPAERRFDLKAFRSFASRSVLAVGFLGLISTMITGGTNQLVNPFLRESFNISYMIAGFFSAVWGIGVTLGGITGGRLTDRLGNRKAITGALFTALVAISLLAVIPSQVFAWPLLVLFGLAYGYYETVFFATSMTVTDPRIAASMFAILMAVSNIGSGLGMVAGGGISDWIGFRWTFVFFAALNFLIIPLLPVISKRQYTKSEERSDKATQLSK
jgi:PAT family beta-lactamase induction signal transducer AmpG